MQIYNVGINPFVPFSLNHVLTEDADKAGDITWIFGIADIFEPHQIVATFVTVLHLGKVCLDRFRPVVELIILTCPRIRQSEKIVLMTASIATP